MLQVLKGTDAQQITLWFNSIHFAIPCTSALAADRYTSIRLKNRYEIQFIYILKSAHDLGLSLSRGTKAESRHS